MVICSVPRQLLWEVVKTVKDPLRVSNRWLHGQVVDRPLFNPEKTEDVFHGDEAHLQAFKQTKFANPILEISSNSPTTLATCTLQIQYVDYKDLSHGRLDLAVP